MTPADYDALYYSLYAPRYERDSSYLEELEIDEARKERAARQEQSKASAIAARQRELHPN